MRMKSMCRYAHEDAGEWPHETQKAFRRAGMPFDDCYEKNNVSLFLAEDSFLGRLCYAELHDLLGRDLDRFAGLRVTAHACLALHQDELAEAGERERVLRFLVSQRGH